MAACQFLSLRALTWLNRQQCLLRALVLRLMQHPLILEVRLVPGVLQPVDPPSRLDSNHQSSMQHACSQAYRLWRVLLLHPKEVQQLGGLIMYCLFFRVLVFVHSVHYWCWCLTGRVRETKRPGCWSWQRKTWDSAFSPTPNSCSQHRGAPMLRITVTTFVGIAGACAWTAAPYIYRYPPTAGLRVHSCHTFGCKALGCSCAVWHI